MTAVLVAADVPAPPDDGLPPGQPYVSPDDLASIPPLFAEAAQVALLPLVAEIWQQSAGTVHAQLVDAAGLPGLPPVSSLAAETYLAQAANTFAQVGDDLWNTARSELLAGFQAGESIPQLADRLRNSAGLTARKATLVARTQVLDASNAGSYATAQTSGIDLRKGWLDTPDNRTRITHRAAGAQYGADQQMIPLADQFLVGGYSCDRPHDPTLPPAERYSCRCTLVYSLGTQAAKEAQKAAEPVAPLPNTSGQIEPVITPALPLPATPLATVEEIRQIEVENAIRAAYRAHGRDGDYVGLAEIRADLGTQYSRAEVDATLRRLAVDPDSRANIVPQSNQKALTQADRAAALHIGGQERHFLHFEDASPRPLPRVGGPGVQLTSAEFDARATAAERGIAADKRPKVQAQIDAAGSDSATWKATGFDGLDRPVPGGTTAVTSYLRRPAFVNDRLRFPNGRPRAAWEGPLDPAKAAKDAIAADRQIAALDKMMAQSPLNTDTVVWRGARPKDINLPDGDPVGFRWTDPGFVSTTGRRSVAENDFAQSEQAVLMRILASDGTPALGFEGLGEAEVLLGRGLTFRVVAERQRLVRTSFSGKKLPGARVVDVEIVPEVTAVAPAVPESPLAVRSVVQLRALAKQQGVVGYSKLTKPQLLERLGPVTPTAPLEGRALREAARERNRIIEARAAAEQTLAELDDLLVKKASREAFEERIAAAQLDPADLAALRAAVGDPVKLRAAVTRISKKQGITVQARSGAKVKFDPALHDPVGEVPAAGTPVVVIRRGTTLTVDGDTIVLNRAVVRLPVTPAKRAPAKAAKAAPQKAAVPELPTPSDPRVAALPRTAGKPPTPVKAAKATNPKFGTTQQGPTYRDAGKAGRPYTPDMGPLPSGAFEENCTNVVHGFEMRMRGFDVQAAPLDVLDKYGYAAGRTFGEIDQLLTDAWRLPDGSPHGRSFAGQAWRSFTTIDEEIDSTWPDGGRGFITVGKHIFNVVKVRGKPVYYEAQFDANTTRNVTALYKRKYRAYGGGEAKLFRVDDLEPVEGVLTTVTAEPTAAVLRVAPKQAAQQLSDSYATRKAALDRLPGQPQVAALEGGISSKVELLTYQDGRRAVRKDYAASPGRRVGPQPSDRIPADNEELAAQVLDAFGIRSPAVVRVNDHTVLMEFVDGVQGGASGVLKAPVAVRDSPEGRLLGLADAVMGHRDRAGGNWLRVGDHIVPIDNGNAFSGVGADTAAYGNPFADYLMNRSGWKNNVDLPVDRGELAAIRRRLQGLRPEFARLNHLRSFNDMMGRLDEITGRAMLGGP